MLNNTRTTTTYWWYRRLAWNMPYHAEHHAYPGLFNFFASLRLQAVPFWQLGEINRLICKEVARLNGCTPKGDHGYWAIHAEILKSLLNSKK